MSYASETALQGGSAPVVVRAEFWGIPWKRTGIDAGGADGDGSTAYSVNPLCVATRIPTAGYTATGAAKGWVAGLASASSFGERYDPVSGATSYRGLTLRLIDRGGQWADAFGVGQAAALGSLSASVTISATSISTGATLSAGQAIHVADECMVVTGGAYNVLRGSSAAGSTARAHTASTAAAPTPDNIYDRPRLLRNMSVALYLGYDVAGFAKSDERGPYLFRLREVSWEDGVWTVTADSTITTLRRVVAFGGYVGRAQPSLVQARGVVGRLTLARPEDGRERVSSFADASTKRTTFLAGGEAVQAEIIGTSGDLMLIELERRGVLGTKPEEIDGRTEWREVVQTDPSITTPRVGYVPWGSGLGSLVASSNPLRAALCMMLSRDAGLANVHSSQNQHDVLPAPWGLDIPAARVDLTSWQTAIDETAGCRMPRFLLGHDGPFALSEWLNDEVWPWVPYTPYTTAAGKIALARVGDVYPFEAQTAIGLGSVTSDVSYQLPSTGTGRIKVRYLGRDGGKRTLIVNSVWAHELHREETRTLTFESAGATDETLPWLAMRAMALIQREELAQPIIRFRMPWRQHATVTPGLVIALTHPTLPDVDGGDYGVSGDAWRVVSVETSVEPRELGVVVEAIRAAPGRRHIGPSAEVNAWDAGALQVTLDANEYTPSAGLGLHVPTADVKAFGADGSQGGAGYLVAFFNADLSRWNDAETIEIVSIDYATNTAVLSKSPNVAAVPTSPVGRIMRLEPMTAAIKAATGSTVHGDQDDYLYLGSDTPPHVLASGVAGNRYGN